MGSSPPSIKHVTSVTIAHSPHRSDDFFAQRLATASASPPRWRWRSRPPGSWDAVASDGFFKPGRFVAKKNSTDSVNSMVYGDLMGFHGHWMGFKSNLTMVSWDSMLISWGFSDFMVFYIVFYWGLMGFSLAAFSSKRSDVLEYSWICLPMSHPIVAKVTISSS